MIEHYKDGTPCECEFMMRGHYDYSNESEHQVGFDETRDTLAYEIPFIGIDQKHGISRYYYDDDNGAIESEVRYVYNKKQGPCFFFSFHGKLIGITPFLDDKSHGLSYYYRESNGTLLSAQIYVHGEYISTPLENFP